MNECEFCKLLERGEKDPTWIADLNCSVAFVYSNQVYYGRTIVVLKHHVESLLELSQEEGQQFYDEMISVSRSIQEIIQPVRQNIAVMGNQVPHLHWHIIPRQPNDHRAGAPPWPHPEHDLSPKEYQQLASRIRNSLRANTK